MCDFTKHAVNIYPPKLSEFLLLIPETTDWCWLLCQFQDLCRVSSDISWYFDIFRTVTTKFWSAENETLLDVPFELSTSSSQDLKKNPWNLHSKESKVNACLERDKNLRWIWPSKCQSLQQLEASDGLSPGFSKTCEKQNSKKFLEDQRSRGSGSIEVFKTTPTSKVNRSLWTHWGVS